MLLAGGLMVVPGALALSPTPAQARPYGGYAYGAYHGGFRGYGYGYPRYGFYPGYGFRVGYGYYPYYGYRGYYPYGYPYPLVYPPFVVVR
jgi:hypothetical protein